MAFWGRAMALFGRFDDKPLQIIHLAWFHGFFAAGRPFSSSIHILVNYIRHYHHYFACRAPEKRHYVQLECNALTHVWAFA